jgi:hypothetical protein
MPFQLSWPVAIAMFAFIAFSVVVGSVLAGAGGWRSLARRYPARSGGDPGEERFRFSSMRTSGGIVGTAGYGSCVTIGVGPRGIAVELWKPFALFHPPFHLPWEAVERCRVVEWPSGSLTQLGIRDGGTITVAGRAGAAIAREAAERGLRPKAADRVEKNGALDALTTDSW